MNDVLNSSAAVSDAVTLALTDRDLLRRFVLDSDADALAEIVRRHQRLVMAVCRRVVGQAADADDAFQATFLVLARRPHSLRRCRSLSGWLYTVAFRTSCRLVRQRKRTTMAELVDQPPDADPDPLDLIAEASDIAAVDEELNRLPQKYRDVLVMAYFSGQTSQQIADQLAESKGQVDGRLRQARRALRVRLARRGVEFSVVAVTASLAASPAAAVSPALVAGTIDLAAQAAGHAPASADALSRFDSLTAPEITVMSTKVALTGSLAGLLLAAIATAGSLLPAALGQPADSPAAVDGRAEDPTVPDTGEPLIAFLQQDNAGEFGGPQPGAGRAGGGSSGRSQDADPTSQYAGLSSARRRAAAERIRTALAETGPVFAYPGEVPVTEPLRVVHEVVQRENGILLHIVPDYAELSRQGIDALDEIVVRNLDFEGLSLHSALELIFAQTTDPKLDYVIRDEVLLVTTAEAAESEQYMTTEMYDVSRVLPLFTNSDRPTLPAGGGAGSGMSSGFGGDMSAGMGASGLAGGREAPGGGMEAGMGMGSGGYPGAGGGSGMAGGGEMGMDGMMGSGGMPGSGPGGSMPGMGMGMGPGMGPAQRNASVSPGQRLLETLQELTAPTIPWAATGGGGTMSITGSLLMVRQSRRGHEAVVDVLEQLESVAAAGKR